jgi:hypothetical protein
MTIKKVHGVNAVDTDTVGCWASKIASFEKGQVVLSNMCRSVQPITLVSQAVLQQANDLI